MYDGTAQPIQLVALDGVPTGSQDGTEQGKLIPVTHLRLPPASRMEFIVTGPSQKVKAAQFLTRLLIPVSTATTIRNACWQTSWPSATISDRTLE